MAGKYGGASLGWLVDGVNMLAAKFKTLSIKFTSLTEQFDGLGDAYEAFCPVGKSQTTLTHGGGLFDTATGSLHALMAAGTPTTPQATPRISMITPMGSSVGAVFYGLAALFTNEYEVLHEGSKLTKANVSTLMAGPSERGQIVQPLATFTADWNTKSLATVVDYTLDPSQLTIPITANTLANPSVVTTPVPHGLATNDIILIAGVATSNPTINGQRTVTVISTTTFSVPVNVTTAGTGGTFVRANSSGGGAGYQQVTALTGFTNYVGKLRDSADDSTYADLLSFADVTDITNKALAAQRVSVAGIIDRFVSHDGNVTGAGSITATSGLVRS